MDNILNIHKLHSIHDTVCVNIDSFKSQSDCEKIMNIINYYYESHKDFNLLLETKDLCPRNISIHCLYIFSSFLNSLKSNKCQYLKKTIIKIYNSYCYDLLYFMFTYLSSPIAIVEVILYRGEENKTQENDNMFLPNIEKINQYFPPKKN